MDELDEIKTRRAAITPLPWRASANEGEYDLDGPIGPTVEDDTGPHGAPLASVREMVDAVFIAQAPADIDLLIKWLDEKEREVDDKSEVGHRVAEAWEATANRLRELLARLEWAGSANHDWAPECPVCQELKGHAHEPGCWLAEALGR
jgi:hypothetical protein